MDIPTRKPGPDSERFDADDAPPLTEAWFERADLYHGDALVRRGRPKSESPQEALNLRLDADALQFFRAAGPGWQTRINEALRKGGGARARRRGGSASPGG